MDGDEDVDPDGELGDVLGIVDDPDPVPAPLPGELEVPGLDAGALRESLQPTIPATVKLTRAIVATVRSVCILVLLFGMSGRRPRSADDRLAATAVPA